MQRSADFATTVVAGILEHQPMSPGKLQFAWRAAAGPAFARNVSLDWRDGRVVVHATSAQWKREIERSRPMILDRLRLLLGRETVRRLDII